jgi:hypothetical protein
VSCRGTASVCERASESAERPLVEWTSPVPVRTDILLAWVSPDIAVPCAGADMPQRSAERAEFQGDPTVRLRTDGSSPWGLLLTSLFFMLLATFVFLLGTSRDGSQSQPYGTARRFARVTLVLRRAAKARSSTGCRRLNRRLIAAENDSAGLTRVALRHSGCA